MRVAPDTVAASATTTTTAPLYFDPPSEHQTLAKPSPRSFKKHKVLPRPRTDKFTPTATRRSPPTWELSNGYVTASSLKTDPVGPSRITQDFSDPRVIGPDLPPTPPAHSRTSSGSHPTLTSSPPPVENPAPSAVAAEPTTPAPGTPTLQKSPPTPDVTPPQIGRRPKAFRPVLSDRIPSKATADSRTESFKTARESPSFSDEDKSTPRPIVPSAGISRNATGRQIESKSEKPQNVGLGLGVELDDDLTPRTKQEFFTFDGEWASNSEVEQEWDDNLNRNVIVRKRRGHLKTNGQAEVIEDVTVTPTNATKALRSVSLHESIHVIPSPEHFPLDFASKGKPRWTASTSESSVSTDLRRSSGMSSKSTVSTVVEAILVDVPPQRQKTLRHVRKQTTLRDSSSEFSPPSSTSTSVRQVEDIRRPGPPRKFAAPRTDSMASTGTANSISSRKARREVWRNGGVPVVVIPDRKESLSKSSGPPSLRSTNSHRSKRSNSTGPVSRSNFSVARELSASSDKPPRRGRSMSITYGSFPTDQLTMDYPPIVPRRRSSLSAPTSRNTSRAGSRAGSLTAESLKAHNALIEQNMIQPPQATVERASSPENTSSRLDQKQLCPAPLVESHKSETSNQKSLVDYNGDPFFGKRLTAYNTPFSQASVETNGTHSAADIAEAMAVNIYPHQNKSVLMIHHMSKPVNIANVSQPKSFSGTEPSTAAIKISGNPEITASGPDGGPVTPPQPQLSMDDVDSPLRNPRAPPEPPAIKFIPATPSGLTPATEKDKMLGNFFEDSQKRPSLVRRAFSLRKATDNDIPRRPGFIARTLSLSKTMRRDTAENPDFGKNKNAVSRRYPTAENLPPDASRLHPFWRPSLDRGNDADNYVYESEDPGQADHYSSFDGHSLPLRRRSLSERMKRTFAILPIEDADHYVTTDRRSPERRTIKRTPSGNLRVMPHRLSLGTVRWSGLHSREGGEGGDERPSTAPENFNRRPWATEKRVDDRGRRIFPGWQEKLEQYKPQNLQRRLSEHRRQKRTEALRQKISGPREVRDGVGDVIKRKSYSGPSYQSSSQVYTPSNRYSRAYDQEI
ncbi:hypothetical protein GGR51DRAFT_417161 [Nemania sp. FL0031]|nr:hypothetical protein GGR51DRAFT_417161 [Nemania sp. FL0031]